MGTKDTWVEDVNRATHKHPKTRKSDKKKRGGNENKEGGHSQSKFGTRARGKGKLCVNRRARQPPSAKENSA